VPLFIDVALPLKIEEERESLVCFGRSTLAWTLLDATVVDFPG
jgi:hypothetical protein